MVAVAVAAVTVAVVVVAAAAARVITSMRSACGAVATVPEQRLEGPRLCGGDGGSAAAFLRFARRAVWLSDAS